MIFVISQYLSKIQICARFYVDTQNLVKIRQSAANLLRIFDFQNGGRPPSWIWYDVIADHPRLVFDGPNILLKLHVNRVYTLQDIAIFIFGPFGLKLPIHAHFGEFWGMLPQMNSDIVASPKSLRPCGKTRSMSHKPWKFIHGFDLGACPRKKYSITNQLGKSHKTVILRLSGEKPR